MQKSAVPSCSNWPIWEFREIWLPPFLFRQPSVSKQFPRPAFPAIRGEGEGAEEIELAAFWLVREDRSGPMQN
jgi:hypothetical protein